MLSILKRACLRKHSYVRNKSTQVLGLSFGSHDTAAALIIDGKVVAACEEERYTGEKHTFAFPTNAIKDCLKLGNTTLDKVDLVAHCSNFEPIDSICTNFLETHIRKMGFIGETRKFSHHLCHIANSYYSSGFDNAVVASFDGIGKFLSSVIGTAKSGQILVPPTIESEPTEHSSSWGDYPYYTVSYPDSIGLLYSGVTKFLGFKELNDEGIVMGLASYGNPNNKIPNTTTSYIDKFREILVENEGMGFTVHPEWRAYLRQIGSGPKCYFDPAQWGTSNAFGIPRYPPTALLPQHKDIAAGLQQRIEEVILSQLRKAKHIFGMDSICLSGGVGLNCAMNGKILTEGIFKKIFVPAAPGDNGLALGAAYLGSRQMYPFLPTQPCPTFYLGSAFADSEIETELKKARDIVYEKLDYQRLNNIVAQLLDQNFIIGYFQGRSEFGPRALGNRSILASSKMPYMNKWINSRVKFREEFRPFAPVVLEDEKSKYYQLESSSWHMQYAVPVRSEVLHKIPATVHVDNTARVQTVSKDSNEKLYNLMSTYFAQSSSPVLLNTSFNVKGQPIVNTPREAIDCFINTNIDFLVLGSFFCKKQNLYYEKRQQDFEKFV